MATLTALVFLPTASKPEQVLVKPTGQGRYDTARWPLEITGLGHHLCMETEGPGNPLAERALVALGEDPLPVPGALLLLGMDTSTTALTSLSETVIKRIMGLY